MHYLIINYKTYPMATGQAAVNLSAKLLAVAAEFKDRVELIVCPQVADIYRIQEQLPTLNVWVQHLDAITPGRNTGAISPATVKLNGAKGALINHSERPLSNNVVSDTCLIAAQNDLQTCVCVNDVSQAEEYINIGANFLAYEPPELIASGSSLLSVSPESAEKFVQNFLDAKTKLLIGAGVTNQQDIRSAVKFGYHGALVASAIVTAAQPQHVLYDLMQGFYE